ncbi:mucoidy inhibitor MuiA family protein [uncultured Rhodoblastus sp.]|uniref:mucoidy inhibitor MuiA family protein n=1 Tax=uncultured Rhodoblastus sp. TaxID=543037 RepID=UPI0025ED78F6|nr:mucoidy inhibitor MuiA family protein [uncultured Rhodoblastus sp.]
MRKREAAALSILALCAAAPARAADIDAASRIDTVTLYPDAALVTRSADVDLPAGTSRLVFHALPGGIDPGSLRVSGEGDQKILLGAVDARKAPAPVSDSALEMQLKKLRVERDEAQVKIDALDGKQAMMKRFSHANPEKLGADGKALKPEDWPQVWEVIGVALEKIGLDLRAARAAVAEIDARIKALETARPTPSFAGPARDVAVEVEAPAAGKFRLVLNYRVPGARWTPAYDARLDSGGKDGKPHLELSRRALISQTTGEDWSNVSLVLAAFPATGGTEAPQVTPRIVDFVQPPVAFPVGAAPQAKAASTLAAAPAPAPMRAEDRPSRIEAGTWQSKFRAPGKVSLASDGTTKNIGLTMQQPEAALSWRISPALDPRAFLSAHFVNGEEAPLLPGQVSIFRDGALVGQSRLAFAAPGAALDLGFGADDRVSVVRAPVSRKENEPSLFGQTRTETREVGTVVRNLHDFPIHAVVTDQTPFSENSAIAIEILGQTTPPDEKSPEGKQGLLRWRFDLAPNAAKELRLAYRLKWPADREVVVE